MSVVITFVAMMAGSPPDVPELPLRAATEPVYCEVEPCVPPYVPPELPRRAPPHPVECVGEDCPADKAPAVEVEDVSAASDCQVEPCPSEQPPP